MQVSVLDAADGADSWHIWKGSISADRSEQVLEKHLLHADVFIREGLQV